MTKVFENLPFKVKAFLLVAVLASFTVVAGIRYHLLIEKMRTESANQSTAIMLDGHKNELKNIVDMMAQTLDAAASGVDDQTEQYKIFSKLVYDARYLPDGSGYMFIYKKGGTVFVLPTQPHLEGKNISSLQDANGKYLIRELDEVAQAGGGFVEYLWEKPGQGVQPKLSYARMIPGDRYWIGTGIYIDDIQREKEQILDKTNKLTNSFLKSLYIALAIGALFVALPLTFVMISSILKPIKELTVAADEFSKGKMDTEIPYTDRKDEIGRLAQSLKRLGMSVKVAISNMMKS
ncbi:MAG: HAMP domain-containing protein [Desulfobulbaceae bacterium]|nr:MAG: HAMP domain-containing protein [Desulfobulbaceae bacterium]